MFWTFWLLFTDHNSIPVSIHTTYLLLKFHWWAFHPQFKLRSSLFQRDTCVRRAQLLFDKILNQVWTFYKTCFPKFRSLMCKYSWCYIPNLYCSLCTRVQLISGRSKKCTIIIIIFYYVWHCGKKGGSHYSQISI